MHHHYTYKPSQEALEKHTHNNPYDWVMICFTWFAGFITCYLWLTS